MSGVVEGVGDDRLVDEHEEGQVGQEAQQVQRGEALELQPDGRLLLQADAAGLQLQEQLLGTDEPLPGPRVAPPLLQEEQEQSLLGVVIITDINNMENCLWTCSQQS